MQHNDQEKRIIGEVSSATFEKASMLSVSKLSASTITTQFLYFPLNNLFRVIILHFKNSTLLRATQAFSRNICFPSVFPLQWSVNIFLSELTDSVDRGTSRTFSTFAQHNSSQPPLHCCTVHGRRQREYPQPARGYDKEKSICLKSD